MRASLVLEQTEDLTEPSKGLPIWEDVFAQLPAWAGTILLLVGEEPQNSTLGHLGERDSRGESRLCICAAGPEHVIFSKRNRVAGPECIYAIGAIAAIGTLFGHNDSTK
jgi:hypothetical protein